MIVVAVVAVAVDVVASAVTVVVAAADVAVDVAVSVATVVAVAADVVVVSSCPLCDLYQNQPSATRRLKSLPRNPEQRPRIHS